MSAMPWHAADWSRLQARRQRNALPHAMLLCGPAGLGKRAFAQRFVRGLLCERAHDGEACGQCRSCLLLDAGTHPDMVTLTFGLRRDGTPRTEIVIEQIRELSSRLAMSSAAAVGVGGRSADSRSPAMYESSRAGPVSV